MRQPTPGGQAPWLPEWLPTLHVAGIRVGECHVGVVAERRNATTEIVEIDAEGVEVVHDRAPAPLWGAAISPSGREPSPAGAETG